MLHGVKACTSLLVIMLLVLGLGNAFAHKQVVVIPLDGGNSLPGQFNPPRNVVFQSNRDGNNEIYVMNVDGTKQTRLTSHEDKSLLNEEARANMSLISCTRLTFHEDKFPLNDEAK